VGIMVTALSSGQIISKSGGYKVFPIVGSVLVTGAALLLSTLDVTTAVAVVCAYVFLLGAGIGFLMQTLVLAVQNDFPTADVGTATSANNFFREIGATLGTAVVGTIFTNRLTDSLSTKGTGDVDSLTPAMVHSLPENLRDTVVTAYQHALVPVFGYLVPVFAIGVALAFLLPEKKLAATNDTA
jgi:MFS family permease